MLIVKVLLVLVTCHLSLITSIAADKDKFVLVIDAGHGGKDGGACANRAKEKNINLSVALAFGKLVEQNCPDVKVIYTRKTDVFIPLHERAAVFISNHTNSVESRKPDTGMETYTMGMRRSDEKRSAAMRENEVITIESDYREHYAGFDPTVPESYIIFDIVNETNMAESVELAQLIQKNVCSTAGRPNKGVKQDAFLVLRETSMPACLIELGYITTASEATYLTNQANVDKMGKGIYQAFVAYKNKRTQTAPTQPTQQTPPQPLPTGRREDTPTTDNPGVQGNSTPPSQGGTGGESTAPVFKVQIMALDRQLSPTDRQFKGLQGVESYQDGNMWKYTVGASENYNDIKQLRKNILSKFPQAFIIAFKNGERVDVNSAIEEFRRNH